MKEENRDLENRLEEKELRERSLKLIESNKILHKVLNLFWGVCLSAYLIYSVVKNQDKQLFLELIRKEGRTGLLEDTLIQNPLYIPQPDGSLSYTDTLAGQWVGYDSNRTKVFGNKATQIHKGRLFAFLLNEIKNNPKNFQTPINLVRIFDIAHICQLDTPGIDELIKSELIQPTTYREGYQKIKIYEQYAKNLDVLEITDDCVYQITPKGNGLISLCGDGGDKRRLEKPLPQLQPSFM